MLKEPRKCEVPCPSHDLSTVMDLSTSVDEAGCRASGAVLHMPGAAERNSEAQQRADCSAVGACGAGR